MKIQSTNINFQMALYMPSCEEAAKILGERAARKAELARPKLEKLAENRDVFLKPIADKDGNIAFGYYEIFVENLKNLDKNNKNNFLSKFQIKNFLQKSNAINREFVYFDNLSERLVLNVEKQIEKLKK